MQFDLKICCPIKRPFIGKTKKPEAMDYWILFNTSVMNDSNIQLGFY